ncbi:MAG: DUF5668 domain-containing protein [Anaerosomatales bacterium]|nr:DUF5668 domain-containing protein [Anaerosomatales bacterium]
MTDENNGAGGRGSEPAQAPPPPAQPASEAPWQPPSAPVAPERTGRRNAGLGWGIVLVVIGGLLLLNQFVPGVQLWRFWPLLIVVPGIVDMFKPGRPLASRVMGGLTTITIGGILLANTLGYLSWSVWWNILSLWPLLIVAAGLGIIAHAMDSSGLRVLSSLVVIGGLLYGAFIMSSSGGRWSPWAVVDLGDEVAISEREPHDGDVDTGVAVIRGGVGELTIFAGRDLVRVEGETPFGDPVYDVTKRGDEVDLEVGLGEGTVVWPGPSARAFLEVALDERVLWDLSIDSGVSLTEADLEGLQLSALSVDVGVSDTTVTLGEISRQAPDPVPVRVEAGVSTFKLRLPDGVNARVRVEGGLNAVDVGRGFTRAGDRGDGRVWLSEGFDEDDPHYDVVISSGVGAVDVQTY